jgi:hypothetical protein
MEQSKKLCLISGAGHSGSTLLGMLLGSHSAGFYGGELLKSEYIGDFSKPERKRLCKICGEQCPLWPRYVPRPRETVYNWLHRTTGASLIIDSTKNLDWIHSRIELAGKEGFTPYLIFLQRDGRAVVNSRFRKYPNQEPSGIINRWISQIEETNQLYHSFVGHKTVVHYEDLAINPEKVLRTLCGFTGLDYEPSMLDFCAHEHHPLGGNTGTQFLVARAQAETASLTLMTNAQIIIIPIPMASNLICAGKKKFPQRIWPFLKRWPHISMPRCGMTASNS